MVVPVPDSEDSGRLFQLFRQAAGFSTAHMKQQITRRLHVEVKLRTEGPGCRARTLLFTLRQEGKLDGDKRVHPSVDIVREAFIVF